MMPLVLRKTCVSSLTREGSGSLLLKVETVLGKEAVRNGYYGQEINYYIQSLSNQYVFT